MREYIHFFENSDLRDAYEYGSDYTEPYVSYTPVINGYEVQFNENTIFGLTVTKQRDGYLISSNENLITIMNPEPPIVNSNVFYTMIPSSKKPAKVVVEPIIDPIDPVIVNPKRIFIIEEDLLLTDESTEFTYDSETFYLVNHSIGDWDVFSDSEHTTFIGILYKNDIVSTLSGGTDFVHYNKKYNVKFIDTYQRKLTSSCAGVTTTEITGKGVTTTKITGKGYNIRDLILVGGIPYSEICDYIQNDTLVIIKFYDTASNGTRYGVYKKSIDTFTNTYPTSTDNTQSYRTVISPDYIEFESDWTFRYNSIYCTFSDYLPTDNSDLSPIDGPIIGPISIDDIK